MRRPLIAGAAGVAALVGLGPRARVREPESVPTAASHGVPAELVELNDWLAARESALGDVYPHATKTVVWAHPEAPAPTERVVLYLHGFSATRQETRPLADSVAARLDANLFYARLAGHGRPGEAMAQVEAGDWLDDVGEAMAVAERLGRRVVLIGTSTGATLALWAASRPEWSERIDALVLISPNLAPADPAAELLLWPWGNVILRAVVGGEREWEPVNEAQARYWTTRYPSRVLLPMMALVDFVRALPLERVRVPVLVVHSSDDQVVSVPAMQDMFARLGSPMRREVVVDDSGDPAHHVLAGDALSPGTTMRLVEEIVEFGGAPQG